MTFTLANRYRGALLGLAAGDALGTTVEFARPGSFEPLTDIVGGGPFALAAGQWTDDTSMALCLADSLIERQAFDPIDQLQRYCRWYRTGYRSSTGRCFDIGGATARALARFERTGEPYCGSEDPHSAGNGSLMRLAPVVLAYADRRAEVIEAAARSSRTTHATKSSVDACRVMAAVLVGIFDGERKEEFLDADTLARRAGPGLHPEVAAVVAGRFREKQPPEIKGSGYAVRSLEAALWAFLGARDFRHGALLAANLVDDGSHLWAARRCLFWHRRDPGGLARQGPGGRGHRGSGRPVVGAPAQSRGASRCTAHPFGRLFAPISLAPGPADAPHAVQRLTIRRHLV